MTETLTTIALLVPCMIIAIVFHEVAHGYAAKALGDPTASQRGRLTLNPIRHVDPVGTLLVPGALLAFGGPPFGWAKPVPVNKYALDNPRFGMMAVAAAGPLSNFVLAGIGVTLLGLFGAGEAMTMTGSALALVTDGAGNVLPFDNALFYFVLINLFIGLFNLLPIPPFDGSHILGGLLPRALRVHWEKLQRVGILLILGVIAASWIFGTGWLLATIGPPMEAAMRWLFGLAHYNPGLF